MIKDIVSFEHININGLSTAGGMEEVEQLFETMDHMEAGVFSICEHTLDITQRALMQKVTTGSKRVNKYTKIEMASCMTETSDSYWKPGGSNGWGIRQVGQ